MNRIRKLATAAVGAVCVAGCGTTAATTTHTLQAPTASTTPPTTQPQPTIYERCSLYFDSTGSEFIEVWITDNGPGSILFEGGTIDAVSATGYVGSESWSLPAYEGGDGQIIAQGQTWHWWAIGLPDGFSGNPQMASCSVYSAQFTPWNGGS